MNKFNSLNLRGLRALNSSHGWSLNDAELCAIQKYFKSGGRPPTLAEVETIAQTWSEHCKHKTFTGPVRYREGSRTYVINNPLKETVFRATKKLAKPWCLSVFKDNAGVVSFGKGGKWALAFKVETHNHPCAIEPYGGAETGVGGVVRDVLGVGLGAKPVLNTDTFCFAPPGHKEMLPPGALAPRRIFHGVVSGVRDYGNRLGIPTASGNIFFDGGYLLNPLVFVGTLGIMPSWAVDKQVKPGDLIVTVGGRTGRDGLHGATFSSATLKETSSSVVQIGHPLNEKRMIEAVLRARDLKLYRALTDCGAGGFSSAIGELGSSCGARVELEKARLKDSNIRPWEIWVSESQERMILAVPPKNINKLKAVFEAEECEITVLGLFTGTGRLEVTFRGESIVDIDMEFLHNGVPMIERTAVWPARRPKARQTGKAGIPKKSCGEVLKAILAHLNVCSREWVIRQYDHEVQGGTVIKPLQGMRHDGPGDACVMWPHAATGDTNDYAGFAVSHGLNSAYGKIDPYMMALNCADEALRNLLCVGADISRAAFLDNFCWGSPDDPLEMGRLIRAAKGCHDASIGFSAPFISGKDSFYNQSKDAKGRNAAVPGTLLISAVAPVHDVRKAVTMDIKNAGSVLYLAGTTYDELGGSIYNDVTGEERGDVPRVHIKSALKLFNAVQKAVSRGLVLSAHDLSQGGLAATAAEMAFSGGIGTCVELGMVKHGVRLKRNLNEILLFSESPSRVLMEVSPANEKKFLETLKNVPVRRIGHTVSEPVFVVKGVNGDIIIGENLETLKSVWKKTLSVG